MEALLQSLAKRYGMEKAMQLLGIDKQQGNPKYAISMGGQNIDFGNMAKKGIFNKSVNAITGGSSMGMGVPLIAGGLGLAYLTNPLRPGSINYNPELQGQIDYASGKGYIGKNPSSGLRQYTDNSVLSGQNVVSMFGTNDYGKQLQKYRDKNADKMSKENLEKLDREIQDQITDDFDKVDKFIKTKTPNNGGGGGAADISDRNRGGYATDDTASFFYKGGIASL